VVAKALRGFPHQGVLQINEYILEANQDFIYLLGGNTLFTPPVANIDG